MHGWFSALFTWYFAILGQFGLPGVVVMTALAVPSELVIPPAAYVEVYKDSANWGSAVLLSLLVIVAGAVGSTVSASLVYWVSRGIGRPIIVKYGKYFFLPEKKLKMAEQWVARYGAGGIMLGTLLPGVRHLICIPAGIMGMRFRTFTLMAFIGFSTWCSVLTVFGLLMSRDMAAMIQYGANHESASCKHAFLNLTIGTAILVALVAVLYIAFLKRNRADDKTAEPAVLPGTK